MSQAHILSRKQRRTYRTDLSPVSGVQWRTADTHAGKANIAKSKDLQKMLIFPLNDQLRGLRGQHLLEAEVLAARDQPRLDSREVEGVGVGGEQKATNKKDKLIGHRRKVEWLVHTYAVGQRRGQIRQGHGVKVTQTEGRLRTVALYLEIWLDFVADLGVQGGGQLRRRAGGALRRVVGGQAFILEVRVGGR